MQSDIDRAEDAVRIAVSVDWTWTIEDIDRFSAAVGWPVIRRSEFGSGLRTAFSARRPEADVLIGGAAIKHVTFTVVDAQAGSSAPAPDLVLDSFAELAARLTGQFGEPTRRQPGARPWIGWDLANLVIFVRTLESTVYVRLVSPEYQREQDHIDEVVIPWMEAEATDGKE